MIIFENFGLELVAHLADLGRISLRQSFHRSGPGESGKSTIFKQMKILQLDGGFSQEEMVKYRNLVFRNCVSEMKVLTTAAQKLEIPLSATQIQVRHHSCSIFQFWFQLEICRSLAVAFSKSALFAGSLFSVSTSLAHDF
jgi:hypothetical protein